jgi:hypothetical protein
MDIIANSTYGNHIRKNKRGNHHLLHQQKEVKKLKTYPIPIDEQEKFHKEIIKMNCFCVNKGKFNCLLNHYLSENRSRLVESLLLLEDSIQIVREPLRYKDESERRRTLFNAFKSSVVSNIGDKLGMKFIFEFKEMDGTFVKKEICRASWKLVNRTSNWEMSNMSASVKQNKDYGSIPKSYTYKDGKLPRYTFSELEDILKANVSNISSDIRKHLLILIIMCIIILKHCN